MSVDYLITNREKEIFFQLVKSTGTRNTKQDEKYKNK